MSDSPLRLPARPSLEHLRKQAKDLLHAEPELAGLADAQFALARRYGFDTWAALKRAVEEARPSLTLAPSYQIDWRERRLTVQAPNDWETVLAVMAEHRLTKLSAGGIGDAALPGLARLSQVTHLEVESHALTDDGLLHLAGMPQLEELSLGGWKSPLTDRGLGVLRELRRLRRFSMCWTQGISDAGLAGLAGCDALERVNVMGTPAGDGTLRALAGKRLTHLNTGRGVTDAGLPLLHELPVFKTWAGGEIEYGLMTFAPEPNHLMLDGPFTDAGLRHLAGLDGLFGLGFFWHCPAFTSAGLASLKELPRLGFLGCQDGHADDEALGHIAAIPRLRMLMGQGAVAGEAGFAALSRSQSLEYFWGRDCPNFGSGALSALARMPSLRGLAVSLKRVDDAALSLLPRFPALRSLMPMDVGDDGFRQVGACLALEHLWCMYCRSTGDVATSYIAGLPGLRSYYAGQTLITDASLSLLGRMSSLEKLEFWQCAGVTDAGVAELAGLPHLREVSFDGMPKVSAKAVGRFPGSVRVRYSG